MRSWHAFTYLSHSATTLSGNRRVPILVKLSEKLNYVHLLVFAFVFVFVFVDHKHCHWEWWWLCSYKPLSMCWRCQKASTPTPGIQYICLQTCKAKCSGKMHTNIWKLLSGGRRIPQCCGFKSLQLRD